MCEAPFVATAVRPVALPVKVDETHMISVNLQKGWNNGHYRQTAILFKEARNTTEYLLEKLDYIQISEWSFVVLD